MGTLIELQDLKKYFSIESGFIKKARVDLKAVDGVSFRIEQMFYFLQQLILTEKPSRSRRT